MFYLYKLCIELFFYFSLGLKSFLKHNMLIELGEMLFALAELLI